MSTKNLARTAIEGGRAKRNKTDRRDTIRRERRGVGQALQAAHGDIAALGDLVLPPRRPIPADHADRLAAALRWLHAHVGRTEDEIEAAVHAAFERRSTEGRHLVDDHLIRRERNWYGGYPAPQTKVVMLAAPGAPRLSGDKSPFQLDWIDGAATLVNERLDDIPHPAGVRRVRRKARAQERKAVLTARRRAKQAEAARAEAEAAAALANARGTSKRRLRRNRKQCLARETRLDAIRAFR